MKRAALLSMLAALSSALGCAGGGDAPPRVEGTEVLNVDGKSLNSLFGAARAAELAGDAEAAKPGYRAVVETSAESGDREELDTARSYLET